MANRAKNATAKQPNGTITIDDRTQKALCKVLQCISKREQEIEVYRQFLCGNDNFEAYSSFQRLDRNQDGFVTPMDIVNFMRDNGQMQVTESACYFIFKFFDSDEDGKLHYPDYLQMILPCTNARMRTEQT